MIELYSFLGEGIDEAVDDGEELRLVLEEVGEGSQILANVVLDR